MKELNKKPGKQKRAFTLVELLIVVGIIGILVVTLVVAVNFSTDKAKQAGVQNIFSSYETAAQKAALQDSGFNDDLMQLASMLNKSLDSELKISVVNNSLTTSATDPWGQTLKIGYSKPDGTVGQVKFVSAGPDMVLGNKDDIISVVTYRATTGSGNAEVSHPQNSAMHNHLYGKQVQAPQYLAKAGSCKTPAVYYLSCECGDVGYDTFTGNLDPSNHINTQITYNYIDGEKHMTTTTCAECLTVIDAHEDPHQGDNYCLLCYGVIHTHAFNQTNIEEKYLYRPATCTSKAIYYYSCGCGEVGTETFEFGNVLAHDYTAQVASSGYLAENASCVQAARYFYSCTMCGEKGSDKFVYGDYNRENHVGMITFEYSPVDATQHTKSSICNACSQEKESQVELHNMNEQHTCTLCGTHTHVFDQQVANDSHLRDSATCTSKPTYFYSCNCGASGTEYFESGEMAPHTYTAEITEPEYLKSNATCVNKSVYYKSCEFCGAKGTDTFEYGDVDSINHIGTTKTKYESISDTQHTKNTVCSSCNNVITSVTEAHVFNANNDCTLCNNHVHVFDKQVVDTKYLKSEATCVAKAVYYYSCKCGETGTTVFEYGNKTDHIFTAEVPSEEYLKTAATCIDKAVYYRSCTGCGLKGTTVFTVDGYDANNHVGVEIYAGTKEVHSKYSCCGATISSTHTYDQNKVESKYLKSIANCVDKAAYYKSCKCGYSNKSTTFTIGSVDSSNHKGPEVYGGTKTCHIKCEACGATLQGEGYHEMEVVPGGTSATCTSDGAVIYRCDCGYGYTTVIPKLGHAPATTPTWTSDHSKATVSCTRSGCTASWSGTSTESTSRNATCTVARQYKHTATFSVNGTTKTFTCPITHSGSALGHLISNPPKNITWTNNNKRFTITCERSGCGQTWTYDLVEGDAEITDVVNPTCTTTGSYKCIIKVTIDGKEYSFKCPGHTTAALGHAPATTATWTTNHSKATVKCTRTGCSKTWSGNSTKKVTTSATCSVAEQYQHTATFSVNGTSKTFTCPTTHTGSTHSHTWSYTCDTSCNCCGCTRTASHNMVQTTAPTCTTTGTKTCSYGCGTTETIAKLEHTYSGATASYTWASGHTSCTASIACQRSGCTYKLTETKSATQTWNTNTTCTTQGKYDYRVTSWSNSSYFSSTSCPDWHYQNAYNHSNVTFRYNPTADGWWASLLDTKHCKIKVCLICNAELSREDEDHNDKSYNQLGTGDGTIWDSRSGICTICQRPWFRDGTG